MPQEYDGTERRKSPVEIAHVLGKLEAFMTTSEKNQAHIQKELDIQLDSVTKEIGSLKEIVLIQGENFHNEMSSLEEKGTIVIENHSIQNKKEHETLLDFVNRINHSFDKRFIEVDEKIGYVEKKLDKHIDNCAITTNEMKQQIEVIEDKPMKSKAKIVDTFVSTFQKVLFTSVGLGFVGFLSWAILQWVNSLG